MITSQMEEGFELFSEYMGEPETSITLTSQDYERFQDIFPEWCIELWRRHGWAKYKKGLLWTINPDEYKDTTDSWLEHTSIVEIDDYYPFARTAFGRFLLWGKKNNRVIKLTCPLATILCPSKGAETPAKNANIEFMVRFAMNESDAYDFYDDDGSALFEAAVDKLGVLEPDEIYGFEPALVLGGACKIENLRRLNMDVHLMLLEQFSEVELVSFNLEGLR